MSRAIIIFILFILLLGNSGYYLIFKAEQFLIRESIESQLKSVIPRDKLSCIVFHKSESINWEREGKEFKYDEVMYDVVSVDIGIDHISYYCLEDKQESKLLDGLMKDILDKNKCKTIFFQIFKLLSTLYDHLNGQLLFKIFTYPSRTIFPFKKVYYSDCFIGRHFPPPKCMNELFRQV